MSDRKDIETGRLAYSCNCGWLDLGHLNPTSTRDYIGAANLWQQLRNESDTHYPECQIYPVGPVGSYVIANRPCTLGDNMQMGGDVGSIGYKVTYRQDMTRWQVGRQRSYLVKKGLSTWQKKSVALAIFLEVSHLFESLQNSFPYNWVTDSGYSQEDLVSNIIGFYIAIGATTMTEALEMCHLVNQQESLRLWDQYGAVGEHKNYRPYPQLLPDTSYEDENARQCRDACAVNPDNSPICFTA